MLEEEIDLRSYIQLIIRYRVWILGITVIAAIVVYAISFLRTPSYQASALIAITEPNLLVQFDPRFETIEDNRQPFAAYPELALSDDVIRKLESEIESLELNDIRTLGQLKNLLEAERGDDPSLIRLTVTYSEAQQAAQIVNIWADIFLASANQLYGLQTPAQINLFKTQLELSLEELQAAENALIQFQSSNRNSIISNELDALNETQKKLLASQQTQRLLIDDLSNFRHKLAAANATTPIPLADHLILLGLQNRVFNIEQADLLQIQITVLDELTTLTKTGYIELVDGLIEIVNTSLSNNQERLLDLEPQILSRQMQLQTIASESSQLVNERDIAKEAYTALARKVEEEKIISQNTRPIVQIASRAATPSGSTGLGALLIAAIAASFSLFLSITGILILDWWQKSVRIEA